jgi:hypothetical protein
VCTHDNIFGLKSTKKIGTKFCIILTSKMVLQHPKDNKKLGKMHFLPYVSEDPLDDGDLHN